MMIYHAEEFHEENIDMEIAIPIETAVYEELGGRSRGNYRSNS